MCLSTHRNWLPFTWAVASVKVRRTRNRSGLGIVASLSTPSFFLLAVAVRSDMERSLDAALDRLWRERDLVLGVQVANNDASGWTTGLRGAIGHNHLMLC